jgi:hypothetical protein
MMILCDVRSASGKFAEANASSQFVKQIVIITDIGEQNYSLSQ